MYKIHYDSLFSKIMDRMWEKSVGGKLFLIFAIIIAFILTIILFCAPMADKDGIFVQRPCVILLAIIFIVVGIVEKLKALYIGAIILNVVHGLIWWGVLFDKPKFIRSIPGKDFIPYWIGFAVFVLAISFLIEYLLVSSHSKKESEIAKGKIYSDNDLMLFQDFDRFQFNGYYLLKARLHNIIRYRPTEATDEIDSMAVIELNPDFPERSMEVYCKENPKIEKIVSYIKAEKEKDPEKQIRVADVVYGVYTWQEINSEGGNFIAEFVKKMKKITNVMFLSSFCLSLYPAITKMLMGIYNDKPTGNLFFVLFFYVFLAIGLYFFNKAFVEKIITKKVLDVVLKFKSSGFKNIATIFEETDFGGEITPKERVRLLRAYALHKGKIDSNLKSKNISNYSDAIFMAVVAAQITQSKKNNSSSSGCSSCGGGCGGCGGCGD